MMCHIRREQKEIWNMKKKKTIQAKTVHFTYHRKNIQCQYHYDVVGVLLALQSDNSATHKCFLKKQK